MPQIILSSLFLLLVYGGVSFYITKRLHRWFSRFCKIRYWLFAVIYAIPASFVWLYFLFQSLSTKLNVSAPVWLRSAIIWIGSVWMGVFVYLLIFLLLTDVIMLIIRATGRLSRKSTDNVRFCCSTAAVVLVVALTVCGTAHAAQIKTVSYEIDLENSSTEELNIALISDLHLGAAGSERNLAKAVDAVNALEPDVVCISGDLFNDDFNSLYDPEGIVSLLRSIKSKYGVYACLGNHDGVNRFDDMLQLLKDSDIILLNDEYKVVDDRFVIVGRLDGRVIGDFDGLERSDYEDIFDPTSTELPVIVMDHNPANISEYDGNTDLILSGHTHKGQIFPANILTYFMYDVHYGYYRADSNSPHVVVTSGAGYWGMPMRIGTDCEIVQIKLTGA